MLLGHANVLLSVPSLSSLSAEVREIGNRIKPTRLVTVVAGAGGSFWQKGRFRKKNSASGRLSTRSLLKRLSFFLQIQLPLVDSNTRPPTG